MSGKKFGVYDMKRNNEYKNMAFSAMNKGLKDRKEFLTENELHIRYYSQQLSKLSRKLMRTKDDTQEMVNIRNQMEHYRAAIHALKKMEKYEKQEKEE